MRDNTRLNVAVRLACTPTTQRAGLGNQTTRGAKSHVPNMLELQNLGS